VGTSGDVDRARVRDDVGGVGRVSFERTREAENDRTRGADEARDAKRSRPTDETNTSRESL
jgi:hypothetical protein